MVGRTYSLYGQSAESGGYYAAVDALVDDCLRRWPDPSAVLAEVARTGRSARKARRLVGRIDSPAAYACTEAARRLADYLLDIETYRGALSLRERCRSSLAMRREQYLLAAVEIELRNRINARPFEDCRERIALLPHCLRDLEATCQSRQHGLDVVCMACSAACYVHELSRLLRRHRIHPYIWMEADLTKLLREHARSSGSLGVLGIACIPELVAGMRRCARGHAPVLGLPLDANRCVRWFGEFRPNTVNLERLERLLAGRTA